MRIDFDGCVLTARLNGSTHGVDAEGEAWPHPFEIAVSSETQLPSRFVAPRVELPDRAQAARQVEPEPCRVRVPGSEVLLRTLDDIAGLRKDPAGRPNRTRAFAQPSCAIVWRSLGSMADRPIGRPA